MNIKITLSTVSDRPVTVNYATANGTATAGSDYTAASGQGRSPKDSSRSRSDHDPRR